MSKILQNEIICNKCGDQIYSALRHHYNTCGCGAVAVDGGMSYLRRVGVDYTDVSVVVEDDLFEESIKALKWANDNGRNELGALCALFRGFRKLGYKVAKELEDEKVD